MPRGKKAKAALHKKLFAPVSLDSAPSSAPSFGPASQPSIPLLMGSELPISQTPNLPLLSPEPAPLIGPEPQLASILPAGEVASLTSAPVPVPTPSPQASDLILPASTFTPGRRSTGLSRTAEAATPDTATEALSSLSPAQAATSIPLTNKFQQSNNTGSHTIQDPNVNFQVLPPSPPNSPPQHPPSNPFPSQAHSQGSFNNSPYFPQTSISPPPNHSRRPFQASYPTPAHSPNFLPINDLLTEVNTLKTRLKLLELTPEERERWDEIEHHGVAYEEILDEFYYRPPAPRPRPGLGFHARNNSSPSGWNPGRGNYHGERRNIDPRMDNDTRGRGRWRGEGGYGRENSTGGVPKVTMRPQHLQPETSMEDSIIGDYTEAKEPGLQPVKGTSPRPHRQARSVSPQVKRDMSPSPQRQLRRNSPQPDTPNTAPSRSSRRAPRSPLVEPESPVTEPDSPITEPPTPVAEEIESVEQNNEPTEPLPENGCHYMLSAGGIDEITVIYLRDSLPFTMQAMKEEREVIRKALEGWNRGEVDKYGIKPSKRAHAAIIYPDPKTPLPRKKLQISLSFTPITPSTSSPDPTPPENIITDINIYIWAQNGTFKNGPLDWYKVGPEGVATRHDGLVEVARLRQALGKEIFAEERVEKEEWEDELVDLGDEELDVGVLGGKGLGFEGISGEEEEKRVGGLVEEVVGERDREDGGEGRGDRDMELAGFI